jgi:putative hydrolase of the HAD superfamily
VRLILKALVLDFGGVVIKTPFEILAPLERRLGVAPGSLAWHGPFDPERDALWRKMQRDEITEREYWALRAEEAGHAAGARTPWSTPELMRALYGCEESEFVRPEARDAISTASGAGLKVAVLTNDLAAFHGSAWYPSLTISESISHVVDASLTRVLKPVPGAYETILAELELEPREALFVDDQLRNVRGAEAVGMPAVHFDVMRPRESFEQALAGCGLTPASRNNI